MNESGNYFKAIRELSTDEITQLRLSPGLTAFHA